MTGSIDCLVRVDKTSNLETYVVNVGMVDNITSKELKISRLVNATDGVSSPFK